MNTETRPQLAAPRAMQQIEMVRSVTGGAFDIDAFHVIDRRDDQLVADEILHGAGSSTFVYDFTINGQQVAGVSVVGARHLAAHYRGLKHRLVASMQKTGELFVAQSFPGEGTPMQVSAQVVPELADEDDFYAAVIEIQDIKTGNAIQVERREARFEKRRDGSRYERPNYQTIAQSKAYRNAVLALVPQDIVIRWKAEMLKLRKSDTITSSVIDEKRGNVLRFAAAQGLALDRRAIEHLDMDQITGLGDAARQGAPAFVNAARGLGLDVAHDEAEREPGQTTGSASPPADGAEGSQPRRRGRAPGPRRQQEGQQTQQPDHRMPPTEEPEFYGDQGDVERVEQGQTERRREEEQQPQPQQRQSRFGSFEV